jgi:hypothetical protein
LGLFGQGEVFWVNQFAARLVGNCKSMSRAMLKKWKLHHRIDDPVPLKMGGMRIYVCSGSSTFKFRKLAAELCFLFSIFLSAFL